MSYFNMDHARWVEAQIAASKPMATKSEKRKAEDRNVGWAAAPDKLNDFQRRAIDILGIVGGGIYNAPIAWRSVHWDKRSLIVSWGNGLGTFDFMQLTRFVFLCHEARIRGYIGPLAPRYLEIAMHERAAIGSISERHPSLDEALSEWREGFPADHSIVYRPQAVGKEA